LLQISAADTASLITVVKYFDSNLFFFNFSKLIVWNWIQLKSAIDFKAGYEQSMQLTHWEKSVIFFFQNFVK